MNDDSRSVPRRIGLSWARRSGEVPKEVPDYAEQDKGGHGGGSHATRQSVARRPIRLTQLRITLDSA